MSDGVAPFAAHDERNGIYLYCLALGNGLPAMQEPGMDEGFPVSQWTVGEIVAVVSQVPLQPWTGSEAESNLENLAWLGPRVVRHEKVVEQAMRHSAILPARFGTIFSSRERLADLIEANYDIAWRFLSFVADKCECAVKGLLDRATAVQQLLDCNPRLSSLPASPGARYLAEQRLRDETRKDLRSWIKTACEAIVNELRNHAVDSAPLPVLPAEASGRDGEMVFNRAFLLTHDQWSDFQTRVNGFGAAYGQKGLTLEWSGPWPPYSFCPSLKPAPTPSRAEEAR